MPDEHPWARFLSARLDAIQWMLEDGRSPEYILHACGLERMQLRLLIMTLEDEGRIARSSDA